MLPSALGGASAIALDANSIYVTTGSYQSIYKLTKAGTSPVELASGPYNDDLIALDSTSVYWAAAGDVVMKVDKSGGTPATLVSKQPRIWGIAVDGTSLYWTVPGEVLKLTPK